MRLIGSESSYLEQVIRLSSYVKSCSDSRYDCRTGNSSIQRNELKTCGDRTFEAWTVTVINDVEFSVRSALEAWQLDISQLDSGIGAINNDYLLSRAFVEQLNKDDSVLARYEFFNMFPQNIGGIELNMGTVDEVETFEVSFDYSHWERVI